MLKSCYKRFFSYFNKNKKSFITYSYSSFLVGILELSGVALTYPFVLKLLSENNHGSFINSPVIIGLAIVLLFIAKNIFMIFYTYFQAKITKAIEAEVNLSFVRYFLAAPYQNTMHISFAEKSNILNCLIPNSINNFILRLLNLSVNFFIFCLISLFLVIKFPLATIITIVCAIVLIYSQNLFFKPRMKRNAKQITKSSLIYTRKTNEALLNIKGVKISNNEKFFFDNYKSAILNFYKTSVETLFFNTIPPYITEPFIIILLFILLAVISCQTYTEPEKLIASFAVIVSAIFRLAPTISRIQVNLNGINSALPIVVDLLNAYEKYNIAGIGDIRQKDFIQFNQSIELKNLYYAYKADKWALKDITLKINKGEFVGIAGLSGAGKTTLADIITGLLKPAKGEFLVDGKEINAPLKIGYIPQEFNLIDGTIKQNVMFGSPEEDNEKVIKALKDAHLYDYIIENYKEGINANPFIDSAGFSQGQKQRLVIARALYSNPDILIMDEATSSLDLKTEDEICSVLKSLKGQKTIIAIAHRLSTIKSADKIVFMKNAAIEDIAAFDELLDKNEDFKELVKLASVKPF